MPAQYQVHQSYDNPYPHFEQSLRVHNQSLTPHGPVGFVDQTFTIEPAIPDLATEPNSYNDNMAIRWSNTSTWNSKQIFHPYSHALAKKDDTNRRKIWEHALENEIFTPYEISTMKLTKRRQSYITSLEAYVDRLHFQLIKLGSRPAEGDLEHFTGLHTKTAKSMIAGLQHDALNFQLKLTELERANDAMENFLSSLSSF